MYFLNLLLILKILIEIIYIYILSVPRSGNHLLTSYLDSINILTDNFIHNKNNYIITEFVDFFNIIKYGYNKDKDKFYILERKNKIYQAISRSFLTQTRVSNYNNIQERNNISKVVFNFYDILRELNFILYEYLFHYLIINSNFKIITYENIDPIFIKSLLEENKDIVDYDISKPLFTHEKILRNHINDYFYELTIKELEKLNIDYKLFEEYFLIQDNKELTISNLREGIEMTNIYKSLENKNYLDNKEFELYSK
jgi:hypothetical protein